MAFPTIPTGTRVVTGNVVAASGTRTFPSLTGLTKNNGDLLIAIIVAYQSSAGAGAPGGTVFSAWGAGFTEFCDQMTTNSSTMAIGAAYKFSDGTETGTFTVTQAAVVTGGASYILLSIPAAHPTAVPEVGTIANGTGAADPTSLTPSWGALDTLWILVGGNGETAITGTWTGIASAPANYINYADTAAADTSTVGECEGAVAFRQLRAASDDPGAFTGDTSNTRDSALLMAVRPNLDATYIRAFQESFPPGRLMPRKPLVVALTDAVAAAGNTYQPTGSLVAGVVLAGTDVFEAAEAGSLIADTLLAGADVFEATRAGSLTPDTTLSGVRVLTYNRLGSLTPDTSLSGADSFNPAEAGSLVSAALLSGADVFTASETGALIADTLLAGARSVTFNRAGSLTPRALLAGVDVFEASEAGTLMASARLFGADVFTAAEAGSLFTQTSLSGADVFTAAETGTLMATGFLSGVGQKVGSITKTGSLTAAAQLYGDDMFTANRLGSLFAAALISGTRSRDRNRTGALTPDTSLSGADVFTASEVGALVALATLVGSRTATFNRRGALSTNALLAGVGLLASSLTMLDPIYTGRIGDVLAGFTPDEHGLIGDTVAGLAAQEERPEGGFIGDTVAGTVEEDHEE